jgi:hypothetical protein
MTGVMLGGWALSLSGSQALGLLGLGPWELGLGSWDLGLGSLPPLQGGFSGRVLSGGVAGKRSTPG